MSRNVVKYDEVSNCARIIYLRSGLGSEVILLCVLDQFSMGKGSSGNVLHMCVAHQSACKTV